MRHILCNDASVELLDREDHVPIFAPDYVAVFDGELFEVLWHDLAVVLRMWMCKDEWLEIHSLGRAVAEEDTEEWERAGSPELYPQKFMRFLR